MGKYQNTVYFSKFSFFPLFPIKLFVELSLNLQED